MLAVMTVHIDRPGHFVDGLGDRLALILTHAVVADGDVDIAHPIFVGQLDIRLGAVNTDDRLHTQLPKRRERGLVVRLCSRDDLRRDDKSVVKMRIGNWRAWTGRRRGADQNKNREDDWSTAGVSPRVHAHPNGRFSNSGTLSPTCT